MWRKNKKITLIKVKNVDGIYCPALPDNIFHKPEDWKESFLKKDLKLWKGLPL